MAGHYKRPLGVFIAHIVSEQKFVIFVTFSKVVRIFFFILNQMTDHIWLNNLSLCL